MLFDVWADFGGKADFLEVLGGHFQKFGEAADMLVNREAYSHFYFITSTSRI